MDNKDFEIKNEQEISNKGKFWKTLGVIALSVGLAAFTVLVINL